MSGGQGPDELMAEGQAMANYAFEQGTPVEDIVIENQSTNTEENLKFSYALMKPGSRFALVTNYYHVFRALLLARTIENQVYWLLELERSFTLALMPSFGNLSAMWS